jgi:hypothetical protein
VRLGETLALSGSAEGAVRVEVLQGMRLLAGAPVAGGRWRVDLPSTLLGTGPMALRARATYPAGTTARSSGLTVQVEEPPRLAAVSATAQVEVGLTARATYADGNARSEAFGRRPNVLRRLLADKVRPTGLGVEGYFEVTAAGFYQIALRGEGPVRMAVDDALLLDQDLPAGGQAMVPVGLEAGRHRLTLQFSRAGSTPPQLILSGDALPTVLVD